MEPLAELGASALAEAMTSYGDALRTHQQAINRLNVYPVPDGDTGTNMALTVQSVVTEIEGLGAGPHDMVATCKAINHGSLMGARGNSGVILSQLLRGLTGELTRDSGPDSQAGPVQMAAALVSAADAARQAARLERRRGDPVDRHQIDQREHQDGRDRRAIHGLLAGGLDGRHGAQRSLARLRYFT